MTLKQLHEKAIQCAKEFLRLEGELIEVLQKIDTMRGYLHYGYSSLFQYAVGGLKLTESQAYSFISIARKSREVPELKKAIDDGVLTAGQGKRIVSVITPENKDEWITKAAEMTQRELEKEIVKDRPEALVKDKMRFVQDTRIELTCGISETLMKEIERVKDLVSQATGKPCGLEGAIQAMTTLYLEKKDPVKKAQRTLSKPQLSLRRVEPKQTRHRIALPASIKHQVALRDRGQCTQLDGKGNRCAQKRWVDIHHVKPVSEGGKDSIDNLVTLCRQHHRFQHEMVNLGLDSLTERIGCGHPPS